MRVVRVVVPVLALGLLLAVVALGTGRAGDPGTGGTAAGTATPTTEQDVRRGPAPAERPGRPPLTSCAEQGYADAPTTGGDVVALVRGPAGGVRAVSFEQGWRVYQGRRPGDLVAVCRAEAP